MFFQGDFISINERMDSTSNKFSQKHFLSVILVSFMAVMSGWSLVELSFHLCHKKRFKASALQWHLVVCKTNSSPSRLELKHHHTALILMVLVKKRAGYAHTKNICRCWVTKQTKYLHTVKTAAINFRWATIRANRSSSGIAKSPSRSRTGNTLAKRLSSLRWLWSARLRINLLSSWNRNQ